MRVTKKFYRALVKEFLAVEDKADRAIAAKVFLLAYIKSGYEVDLTAFYQAIGLSYNTKYQYR